MEQSKPHASWWDYAVSAVAIIVGISVALIGFQKGNEQISVGTYIGGIAIFVIAEIFTCGLGFCFNEVDNAALEQRALWVLWGIGILLLFLIVEVPVLTFFKLLMLSEQTVDFTLSACLALFGVLHPSFCTLRVLRRWRSAKRA
jgi:hypothetical protein